MAGTTRRALVGLALVAGAAGPAEAADASYGVLRLGARVAAARVAPAGGEGAQGVAWLPELGGTVYGGDWFLKLDLGGAALALLDAAGAPLLRPTGSEGAVDGAPAVAQRFGAVYGRVEVGPHWPVGPGALAVGLIADGVQVGLRDRARTAGWIRGGPGLEGGLSLRYAWPALDGLRLDPALLTGGGLLFGRERAAGVWARAEVQAFVAVVPHVSLHLGAGLEGFRYAGEGEARAFSGRALTVQAGIALHGLLGLGEARLTELY